MRLIFIRNAHLISEKMKYDFVRDKILPAFSGMLVSAAGPVKEQSLLVLGKFLAVCLRKIHSMFNPRTEVLDNQLKIFFNLFLFTEGLDRAVRLRIIAANSAELTEVMSLFAKKLWPYLRFALEKLDEYPDAGIVEAAKLALVRQVGPLAALLVPVAGLGTAQMLAREGATASKAAATPTTSPLHAWLPRAWAFREKQRHSSAALLRD